MRAILTITAVIFFLSTNAQNTCQPLNSNGLVAYYPFCGNANDVSGNQKHGSVTGAKLVADRFGNPNSAYEFDSDQDFITLDSVHQSNVLNYSIVLWFKQSADSKGAGGTMVCGSDPAKTDGLRLATGATDQVFWIAEFDAGNSYGIITYDQNYADGDWHFVAVTFESEPGVFDSSAMAIYIDNVRVPQKLDGNPAHGNAIAPIDNDNRPVVIGNITGKDNHFPGVIDDVYIFDRCLSREEIRNLYNLWHVGVLQDTLASPKRYTYPNPSSTQITVKCETSDKVQIFNSMGTLVLEGVGLSQIDISSLSEGLYTIRISDLNGYLVKSSSIIKSE